MPISRKYNAIFIHIPKSAGTSIENALDIPIEIANDKNINRMYLMHYFEHDGVKHEEVQHYPISKLINYSLISDEENNDFFKFSFVRNPWEKAVSEYFHQNKYPHYFRKNLCGKNFRDFMMDIYHAKQKCFHDMNQCDFIYDNNGQLMVDFVGRYENIDNDWKDIKRQLGIDRNLPHLNCGKYNGYHKFYDHDTKLLVEHLYKKDIELFNYKF